MGTVSDTFYVAGPEAFPAFKFDEVCKYFTDISFVAMGNCSYLIANNQTWAKLSAADQKLMRTLCRDYGIDRAKTWDKYNDQEIEVLKTTQGKEAIAMSPAEQQKMKDIAQQVVDIYIKDTTAKGLPAADYVNFFKERIDYWTKNQ